jgi:hypothetical protein
MPRRPRHRAGGGDGSPGRPPADRWDAWRHGPAPLTTDADDTARDVG